MHAASHRLFGLLVVCVALPLAAYGCGDDSGDSDGSSGAGGAAGMGGSGGGAPVFDAGSDPDRNMVSVGEFCQRLAEIQCAGEAFCCPNPGRDRAACEAAGLEGCRDTLQLDTIGMSDKLVVDAANVAAAFEEFEQRASQCDTTLVEWAASRELSTGILGGTIAEGGDCTPEDANDVVDLGAALFACANGTDVVCNVGDPTWTCEPRGTAGSSCLLDWNCEDGQYCSAGRCTPRLALGESCDGPNQCLSFFCAGDVCVEPTVELAYCLAE
jgi:hypothetical protein